MNKSIIVLLALVFTTFIGKADVKLADVFTSNMVLQRNLNLKVWGSADPGEKVTLSFKGQKLKTKADNAGLWSVQLKPMQICVGMCGLGQT